MKFSILIGAVASVSLSRESVNLENPSDVKTLEKMRPKKFVYPDAYGLGTSFANSAKQTSKPVIVKPTVSFMPGAPKYIEAPVYQPYVVPAPLPYVKEVKIPVVHTVPEFHNKRNRDLHRHIYGDYPEPEADKHHIIVHHPAEYRSVKGHYSAKQPEAPAAEPEAPAPAGVHYVHHPHGAGFILPFRSAPKFPRWQYLQGHSRLHDKVW